MRVRAALAVEGEYFGITMAMTPMPLPSTIFDKRSTRKLQQPLCFSGKQFSFPPVPKTTPAVTAGSSGSISSKASAGGRGSPAIPSAVVLKKKGAKRARGDASSVKVEEEEEEEDEEDEEEEEEESTAIGGGDDEEDEPINCHCLPFPEVQTDEDFAQDNHSGGGGMGRRGYEGFQELDVLLGGDGTSVTSSMGLDPLPWNDMVHYQQQQQQHQHQMMQQPPPPQHHHHPQQDGNNTNPQQQQQQQQQWFADQMLLFCQPGSTNPVNPPNPMMMMSQPPSQPPPDGSWANSGDGLRGNNGRREEGNSNAMVGQHVWTPYQMPMVPPLPPQHQQPPPPPPQQQRQWRGQGPMY